MAIPVLTIIRRVQGLLGDPAGDRWTDTLCLSYLNAAQRKIVNLKPEANPVLRTITLGTGARHLLDDSVVTIMSVGQNRGMGSDYGDMILPQDWAQFTGFMPSWANQTKWTDGPVKNFMLSPRMPWEIWVYPGRKTAGWKIDLTTSQNPSDIGTSDDLTLYDTYEPMVVEFMQYLALTTVAEFQNMDRAMIHYKMFMEEIGQREAEQNGAVQSPPYPIEGRRGK